MDSLSLYKGKLNDALALVPSMCHENKRQAVDFWNVVARQLEVIVHDDETTRSSYGYHSTLNSPELHQAGGQLSPEFNLSDTILHETKKNVTTAAPTIVPNNPIITTASSANELAANGDNLSTPASLSTSSQSNSISTIATSHLVTPIFKQTSVPQFQQESLPNKTVFDTTYLDQLTNQVVEESANLAAPAIFNNKMSSVSPLSEVHSMANFNSSSQDDGICTGLSVDVRFHESDQILSVPRADSTPETYADMFKHHHSSDAPPDPTERIFVSGAVTTNTTTTTTSEMDLYSSAATTTTGCAESAQNQQQINAQQLINYLLFDQQRPSSGSTNSPTKHTNKQPALQANLQTGSLFTEALVTNSLGCPQTTANVRHEIGNGQFDRGPKMYELEAGERTCAHERGMVQSTQQQQQQQQQFQMGAGSSISIDQIPVGPQDLFTHSDRPLQQIQYIDANQVQYSPQQQQFYHTAASDGGVKPKAILICDETHDIVGHHNNHQYVMQQTSTLNATLSLDKLSPSSSANNNEVLVETQVQQLVHIKLDEGTNRQIEGQPTCEICGKSGFSTKGNLKRHLRSHSGEKPYKCEFCESRFTEKKSLKIHMRRHTGEKPYKCQVCGKLFSQTGVLQSHMALHLNERKFDCPKCAKAFRQRSQLKLHIMRHDGVKRLECSTCRARFLTKGDLERHCRTHTGERPYACQMCPKTFTRQQSLNEHVNRHTGRRPYDCKHCDKTFSEMSACYKHAKTHKKEEPQAQQQDAIVS